MIDLEFLQSLINALDQSGLDSIELERGGTRVRLARTPTQVASPASPSEGVGSPALPSPSAAPAGVSEQPAPADADEEDGGGQVEIHSPMVGTFYRAPAPDAPPYADVGDRISKGDTLCIIEAMKLMNELEADVEGTIKRVLVENGEPVEYGQVLFLVDPA